MSKLTFTRWQLKILDLIAEGCTSQEIADQTCRQLNSIDVQRKRLREKIGIPRYDRYAFLKWLSENGWDVDPLLLGPQSEHYLKYQAINRRIQKNMEERRLSDNRTSP